MANERTFLAWIRRCIGCMAFGFAIEKVIIPFDYRTSAGGYGLFDEHRYVTWFHWELPLLCYPHTGF